MVMNIKALFLGVAAFACAAAIAPAANAGCGADVLKAPASWNTTPSGQTNPLLMRVNMGASGIVGMWSVNLYVGSALVDWGYAQWHSDGTEIMNSGGHSPAGGNFCLGTWAQTGARSYRLIHFPLAYNPATGALAAKIILKEDVVVDPAAASFAGSFTEDVYAPNGTTLLQHVAGRITGERVTVN